MSAHTTIRRPRLTIPLVLSACALLAAASAQLARANSRTPSTTASNRFTLETAERDRVLASIATLLDRDYVFPDVGRKMAAALRSAEERGTYSDITDGQIFALRLNDDLQAINHDEHLGVHFSATVLPPYQTPETSPAARQAIFANMLASNCGFEKVEHLVPNIGYLKIDEFDDPPVCAPIAAAAMGFVANSDALIIDVRDNRGGRGTGILSYLFAKPTHLMDMFSRHDHAIHELWTSPNVAGRKFVGKPVFVLTSSRTFSDAEAFAYALKTLKRATLIGETTKGGAHTMEIHRIDDHYAIHVPFGQFISPITHTDWEGTGVEPDIKVPAAQALDEALRRARAMTETRPPSS